MPILKPDERVGTLLGGRYRIDRIIGSGGMGVVFEGVHALTGRRVAVKVLKPQFVEEQGVVERFFREARAAASLAHPNIVTVIDMGEAEDGAAYLVLEHLDGAALSGHMTQGAALDPAWVLDVLLPVMDALQRAHESGVVHRDIKPDNIFVSRNGAGETVPKLLDFGIAKLTESDGGHATATGAIVGTPAYMAPEQAAGKPDVGTAADVWSIGMVALEALAGAHPVDADSVATVLVRIVTQGAPPAAEFCPSLAPALAAVLDRALEHQPGARWPTMRAFSEALHGAAQRAGIATHHVPLSLRGADAGGGSPLSSTPGIARTAGSAELRQTEICETERPPPDPGGEAGATDAGSNTGSDAGASRPDTYSGSRFDPKRPSAVTVVRPYRDAIRERVFERLQSAGLRIDEDAVIPLGTPDEEAVERVLASPNRVLLVPFHGHRDGSGERIDGINFLAMLDRRCGGAFRWRVIMPTTSFGAAAVTFGLSDHGPLPAHVRDAIFVLPEDALDDSGIARRIGDHVRAA